MLRRPSQAIFEILNSSTSTVAKPISVIISRHRRQRKSNTHRQQGNHYMGEGVMDALG